MIERTIRETADHRKARGEVLRKQHTAEERAVSAHLVRRFTLFVIKKLKAAGFGHKQQFFKEIIDPLVVGKQSVAVSWKLSLSQRVGTRTRAFLMGIRMVGRMSQRKELTLAFRFGFK